MAASNSQDACTLPYPDRFHAAVNFFVNSVPGAKAVPDELRLALFALHQQATVGPCTEAKPWGWNVVESAKWESWNQLGNMSSVEAMRLYVKLIEEEQPDWWALAKAHKHRLSLLAAEEHAGDPDGSGYFSSPPLEAVPVGVWSAPFVEGPKRPPPRYEHAAAALGPNLYIVGGNCGGRYLGDVWILALDTLTWTPVSGPAKSAPPTPSQNGDAALDALAPVSQPLPPCAGHAMIAWGSKLLVLGGHMKAKDTRKEVQVSAFDTQTTDWTMLEPSGTPPTCRGGHSATLVGGNVYIFGGEDSSRRPMGELLVLDLVSMAWVRPDTSGLPPAARSAHTALAYKNRFLVIFGGGSVAHCYNDVTLLDTKTNEWSCPQTEGTPPTPRAGHAAAMLGDGLYIVGGGNNSAGCADLVCLDMSGLATGLPLRWSSVTTAEPRSAIASEGLSLVAARGAGALVAYGGYNGRYHSSVHVFRPAPEGARGAEDAVASGAEAKQDQALAGKSRSMKADANGDAGTARRADSGHLTSKPSKLTASSGGGEAAVAREEAAAARREAAAAKEAAAAELALMRRELSSAQSAAADAEAALAEAQKKLETAAKEAEAQSTNIFRLEVQLAEAQKKLQTITDLEKELNRYRKEAEQKSKGGVWGYISGA
ncbi:g11368 [Coccomyxa elongata]